MSYARLLAQTADLLEYAQRVGTLSTGLYDKATIEGALDAGVVWATVAWKALDGQRENGLDARVAGTGEDTRLEVTVRGTRAYKLANGAARELGDAWVEITRDRTLVTLSPEAALEAELPEADNGQHVRVEWTIARMAMVTAPDGAPVAVPLHAWNMRGLEATVWSAWEEVNAYTARLAG